MERIRTSCRLCFNGCGVLVSMDAGRPVAVKGDPEHPVSRGRLCPRGKAALEVLNHPDRLRRPLVRDGERGAGRWRPVDWEEALDTVIRGLKDTADRLGPQAVAFMRGGSKGTSDDHLTRLANIFGSPNVSTTSSICYSATSLASVRTYGFIAYPDMAGGPRCIVGPSWASTETGRATLSCRGQGVEAPAKESILWKFIKCVWWVWEPWAARSALFARGPGLPRP